MEVESREFANQLEEQETAVTGCKRSATASELVSKSLNRAYCYRRVACCWRKLALDIVKKFQINFLLYTKY